MTGNIPPGTRILGSLRSADGKGVVRVEDRYDTDIDDLWSALVDPGRLARWYGQVEGDLRPDGEFRLYIESADFDTKSDSRKSVGGSTGPANAIDIEIEPSRTAHVDQLDRIRAYPARRLMLKPARAEPVMTGCGLTEARRRAIR